jgi:hypothetical protein
MTDECQQKSMTRSVLALPHPLVLHILLLLHEALT